MTCRAGLPARLRSWPRQPCQPDFAGGLLIFPDFHRTVTDFMRIALGIEYDGTDFYGWQRLKSDASVQTAVENALSRVAAHPVEVSCAGRTDAGVHGRCQVVHFDTEAQRDMRGWVLGACSSLPETVAVLWAQ